jgi:WD40 repeat protein
LISAANAPLLDQATEVSFLPWELVNAIDWSPGGETLAVAAGGVIYLVSSRELDRQGSYETGALTHSLDFNPQGDLLAAGSRDGLIRMWDLPNKSGTDGAGRLGDPVLAFDAHNKGVNCVLFSPDGSRLASGGNDAMVRLWETGMGEEMGNIIGGTFAIPSISFSLDGATLAIVNGDVVRFREVGSGRIKGTLRAETTFYSSALSPDGETLAVGDIANTIRLWSMAQVLANPTSEAPAQATLSGHEGIPGRPSALIWGLAFHPDGDLLASAGGDGSIRIWDLQTGQLAATLIGHQGGATSVVFSPDGRWLASGGLDATLRLWGVK